MRAFHRCFLPSFSSFGWGVLEAYLSVIQFIANCILLISIFKLELSPFPQKNRFFFYKAYNHEHELPGRPCLLMDRDEMRNFYRGPSIDASYQVSVHLAEGFQMRRLKCEKLTDDGKRTTDAKWWQKLTLPLARWAKNVVPLKGSMAFPLSMNVV
jgi:hypothetical protein